MTIEDQLVVSANRIAVNNRCPRFPRHLPQHHPPALRFAEMIRRGAEIEQQIHPLLTDFLHRIAIVKWPAQVTFRPNILADRHANALAPPLERLATLAGLEVAAFVEHVVGWEQRFPKPRADPTLLQPRRSVPERLAHLTLVKIHIPHQQRHLLHLIRQIIERLQAFRHELALENKIPRRITHQAQLRRDHQLGALFHTLPVSRQQALRIPRKVPHHRVDLCNSYFHTEQIRLQIIHRDRLRANPLFVKSALIPARPATGP